MHLGRILQLLVKLPVHFDDQAMHTATSCIDTFRFTQLTKPASPVAACRRAAVPNPPGTIERKGLD
ncbi:hypothetical protein PPUN110474_37850 [Pseudomonas putida]|nr:hypothetical protein PPUN110474_37850 [Pseudomonas putida]